MNQDKSNASLFSNDTQRTLNKNE